MRGLALDGEPREGGPQAPPEVVDATTVTVSVLQLLEGEAELAEQLARLGPGSAITVRFARALSFAGSLLAELDPHVAPAQVDAAVRIVQGLAKTDARVRWLPEETFVGVTAKVTPMDLRRHLDGLRRHRILVDPVAGATDTEAILDLEARALVREIRAHDGPALERQRALARALDRAAGVARGDRNKHLRVIPAPRHDPEAQRRARSARVDLPRRDDALAPARRAAMAIQAVRDAARSGATRLVLAPLDGEADWYLDELLDLARRLRFAEVTVDTKPRSDATPSPDDEDERGRVRREMVSVLHQRGRDGSVREHHVVRVLFHCNQACDFCFVSRELPPAEHALVEAAIADAAARGASLALSGGEPTLSPRLAGYLAQAAALGIDEVQLQTNAVKLSDAAYADTLVAAGLRFAFVSLHGVTAETSDRVTAAPGTFGRTLAGVRNLLARGVRVVLSFVLCAHNAPDLAALPDFVARELRPSSRAASDLTLNFSFVAPGSDNVPRDTGLMPRFTDIAWALEAAVDRAKAQGLPLVGFDSQCGVPACFLPAEVREAWFVEDLPLEELRVFGSSFRKSPACAACSLDRRCYGLRAGYAETYGTDELHPLA